MLFSAMCTCCIDRYAYHGIRSHLSFVYVLRHLRALGASGRGLCSFGLFTMVVSASMCRFRCNSIEPRTSHTSRIASCSWAEWWITSDPAAFASDWADYIFDRHGVTPYLYEQTGQGGLLCREVPPDPTIAQHRIRGLKDTDSGFIPQCPELKTPGSDRGAELNRGVSLGKGRKPGFRVTNKADPDHRQVAGN